MSDGKISTGSKTFDLKKNDANSFRDQKNFFYVSRGDKIDDLKGKLSVSESGILLIAGPYFSGKTNLCYEWYSTIQEKKIWISLSPGSSCFSKAIEELSSYMTLQEENDEIQMTREDEFSGLVSSLIGEGSLTMFLDDFYEDGSCDHCDFVRFVRDILREKKKFDVRCVCVGHDPRMNPFKDENLEYQPFFSAKDIVCFLEQIEEEYQFNFSADDSLRYISEVILDEFGGHCGLTCSFLQVFLDRRSERKRPEYSSKDIGDYELLEQCLGDLAKDPNLCRKLVNQTRCETSYRLNMESLHYYLDLCKGRDPELQELQDYLTLDERTRVMIQDLFANGFVRIERIGNWLESEKKFKIVEVSSFHRRWAMERYRELWEVENEVSIIDIQEMEEEFRGKKYHDFFKKLLQFVDVEFLMKKCCWSKIRYEGPSEKAYKFEFYRLLSQFSHFRTFAEYLVEKFEGDGKKKIKMGRMDIVLEVVSTGEKYNVELIANSAFFGRKHSVEQHWMRNLQKYDKGIVRIAHHFCIAFYHRTGRERSLVKENYFTPKNSAEIGGKLEEDKGKQDLFYFVTNDSFSEMSTYYFNEDYEEYNKPFGKKASLEKPRMIDEEKETKVFRITFKTCIQFAEGPMGNKKELYREMLVHHLLQNIDLVGRTKQQIYKEFGGKKKNFEDYRYFTIAFEDISLGVGDNLLSGSFDGYGSEFYFCTGEQMMAIKDSEEEARKRKEEEEARKRKEEEEARKLKKNGKVKIFLVKSADRRKLLFCDISLDDDLKKHEREKTIETLCEKKIIRSWRENDVKGLELFEYVSVKNSSNYVVGDEFDCEDEEDFEDFGNFLVGKISFLVTKEEKMEINELYVGTKSQGIDITKLKEFRAGNGMGFLDKWFDDEDEERGTGAISVDCMKDEESEWNKEILLECFDGGSLRKNLDDLLQKSRFFRKMLSFNGKEAHEAREYGKIKLEFLSSLELEYYLKVIFDVEEVTEVGGSDNNSIRLLLRLLEFGMRYMERELAKKVVNELETVIFPDLVSCGVLELRLMELGYLVHGRLPNGLLEELLDRLCSQHSVGQAASKMMRHIEYSSQVMEKAHRFLEEGEKDMLDEGCFQVDYGVGEVVSGNGDVLDQCFVGEFGGRLMVWNEGCDCSSSFVGCLKDSTFERNLIKTKRRREEEYSGKVNCVGGKVRKLMTCGEIESFLRK